MCIYTLLGFIPTTVDKVKVVNQSHFHPPPSSLFIFTVTYNILCFTRKGIVNPHRSTPTEDSDAHQKRTLTLQARTLLFSTKCAHGPFPSYHSSPQPTDYFSAQARVLDFQKGGGVWPEGKALLRAPKVHAHGGGSRALRRGGGV